MGYAAAFDTSKPSAELLQFEKEELLKVNSVEVRTEEIEDTQK